MTDQAFQLQYRQEYVAAYEQKTSYFRNSAVNDVVIKGNQAQFLVAGTGGAQAVTRGTNGLIPGRTDSLVTPVATLQEWHDKPQRTSFNIFASQGNGRQILQEGSVKVMNRKIDDLMIAELSNATQNTGTATTLSLNLLTKAQAILGNADVDIEEEDNMFCAISPAANALLIQIKEFANAQYVDVKPFEGASVKMRRWAGLNFFVSNRLVGRTTNAEKLLMWHRNAIGYAADVTGMSVVAGYNEENDYYFARSSMNLGVKLLQNSGAVIINHDGSNFVTS